MRNSHTISSEKISIYSLYSFPSYQLSWSKVEKLFKSIYFVSCHSVSQSKNTAEVRNHHLNSSDTVCWPLIQLTQSFRKLTGMLWHPLYPPAPPISARVQAPAEWGHLHSLVLTGEEMCSAAFLRRRPSTRKSSFKDSISVQKDQLWITLIWSEEHKPGLCTGLTQHHNPF